MLRSLSRLATSITHQVEPSLLDMSALRASVFGSSKITSRYFHITPSPGNKNRKETRKLLVSSMPKPDEGTSGEKFVDIDSLVSKVSRIPDENTPNLLFNGVPFKELPIVHIRVTHNNTIVTMSDYKGVIKIMNSCGREGFKNARKGTNVAAQATAIAFTMKALEMGFKTVRVLVRGLGPGRLASIKGLQIGGLNIVSVTDATRVTWNPLRPRKARRL